MSTTPQPHEVSFLDMLSGKVPNSGLTVENGQFKEEIFSSILSFLAEHNSNINPSVILPPGTLEDGLLTKTELLTMIGSFAAGQRGIPISQDNMDNARAVATANGITDRDIIKGLATAEQHLENLLEGPAAPVANIVMAALQP